MVELCKEVIFGAPGTGKTHQLLDRIGKMYEEGILFQRMAFCTFTRAAAEEARERMESRFGIDRKEMPWFGTFHAICWKLLSKDGLKCQMVKPNERVLFCKNVLGLEYEDTGTKEFDIENFGLDNYAVATTTVPGNLLFELYDAFRLREQKGVPECASGEFYERVGREPIMNRIRMELGKHCSDIYVSLQKYELWKQANSLIDYTDMLLRVLEKGLVPPCAAFLFDEFQDVSALQYALYERWSRKAERIVIAGDDDQCIYTWAGAKSDYLLNEARTTQSKTILGRTFRMRSVINGYAKNYAQVHIRNRQVKDIVSAEEGGNVFENWSAWFTLRKELPAILQADLTMFVLCRTNYYVERFVQDYFLEWGVPFAFLKRGGSPWAGDKLNLFLALEKLAQHKDVTLDELKALLKHLPSKNNVERGLKKKVDEMKESVETFAWAKIMGMGVKMTFLTQDFKGMLNSLRDVGVCKDAFLKAYLKGFAQYGVLISVGTKHASKGKEADVVVNVKDCPSLVVKSFISSEENRQDEYRLEYVAMTRAKSLLVNLRGVFDRCDSRIMP